MLITPRQLISTLLRQPVQTRPLPRRTRHQEAGINQPRNPRTSIPRPSHIIWDPNHRIARLVPTCVVGHDPGLVTRQRPSLSHSQQFPLSRVQPPPKPIPILERLTRIRWRMGLAAVIAARRPSPILASRLDTPATSPAPSNVNIPSLTRHHATLLAGSAWRLKLSAAAYCGFHANVTAPVWPCRFFATITSSSDAALISFSAS